MPFGECLRIAEIKDRKGLKCDKLVIYVRKFSQKATDYFAVGAVLVNYFLPKTTAFKKNFGCDESHSQSAKRHLR